MLKHSIIFIALAVMVALAIFGLSKSNILSNNRPVKNNEALQVAVSILPQIEIVKRIGGERVQVAAMIKPGFSPATYEPTPEDVAYLSQSQVYFRIGKIGFEQTHLSKLSASNPQMLVVDTSRDIVYRELAAHSHDEAEEDHEHEEEASAPDPHVWLAPQMVKQQSQVIADTLIQIDPSGQDFYQQNLQQLHKDLDELDKDLAKAFAPISGETLLVYHPAFGYLADSYGFTQEHFEIEGKEPTLQQLTSVIEMARADGVQAVFVQKQFSIKSAEVLAKEIGAVVVAIDPLDPDYFANMRAIANQISSKL